MSQFMTDEEKLEYIEKINSDFKMQTDATQEDLNLFYQLVEEGIEKDWTVALEAKGYGCYGGNELFECDWAESLKCISRLAELTGEPQYYNTLGYIYYYGRCNNKVPQNDEAFKCFSIGAACGYFESTYKLADMFQHGYGVPKNYQACRSLVMKYYYETLEMFCNGAYAGNFSDVALRMGGLFEKGIDVDVDYEAAYTYFLQAKTASDMRLMTSDGYGDDYVDKRINEAIARVMPRIDADFFKDSIDIEVPGPIGDLLSNSSAIDLTLKKKKGHYYLQAESHPSDESSGMVLITVGNMKYCQLVNKTGVYINNPSFIHGGIAKTEKYVITGIHFDQENETWEFTCSDQVMLSFKCDSFTFAEKESGVVFVPAIKEE